MVVVTVVAVVAAVVWVVSAVVAVAAVVAFGAAAVSAVVAVVAVVAAAVSAVVAAVVVVVVVVVAFELEPFPLFSVVARFVVCAVVTVGEIIINDTFTALLLLADHTNLLFAYKDLKSQSSLINIELQKVYAWLNGNKLP